jgi:hypothetical protein
MKEQIEYQFWLLSDGNGQGQERHPEGNGRGIIRSNPNKKKLNKSLAVRLIDLIPTCNRKLPRR